MLVKFGYCIICDNGPDGKNRAWVEDLIKVKGEVVSQKIITCTSCKGSNNLLYLEVKIPGLGLKNE